MSWFSNLGSWVGKQVTNAAQTVSDVDLGIVNTVTNLAGVSVIPKSAYSSSAAASTAASITKVAVPLLDAAGAVVLGVTGVGLPLSAALIAGATTAQKIGIATGNSALTTSVPVVNSGVAVNTATPINSSNNDLLFLLCIVGGYFLIKK